MDLIVSILMLSGAALFVGIALDATRFPRRKFAVCIKNHGYDVALEVRKMYRVLPDAEAAKHKQIRVIDESGECLYPKEFFAFINLPTSVCRALDIAV
jgi:hypothetical protein